MSLNIRLDHSIEAQKQEARRLSSSKRMHDMKRVDLTFLDNAPFLMTGSQKINAPKEDVFQFLKVAENWYKWHTGITKVIWTSPSPFKKGTTRTVEINGKFVADEEFILWEENHRFNFIFLRSNIPMSAALMEDFLLKETEDGFCELRWIVAGETSGILKLFNGLMKRIQLKGIEDSAKNLANCFN